MKIALPVRSLSALLVLCAGVTAVPAEGQSPVAALRAGLAVAGTGDPANCAAAPSVAGGVEARTGGRLFVGASADLHLGVPFACTDMGVYRPGPDGRWRRESGGAAFLLAPRLGYFVGMGGTRGDLAVGGGLLWSSPLDADGLALQRQPWLGARGAVGLGGRWSVQAEAGRHRVPITLHFDGFNPNGPPMTTPLYPAEERHENRWEGFAQVGVRRRL